MPAFRPLLPLALASAGLAGGVLGARPAATGQPAGSTRAAGGAAILGAHDPAWSPAGPAHRALDPRSDLDPRRRRPRPSRGRALAGPRQRLRARPGVVARRAEAGLRRPDRRQRLRSLRRRCRRRRAAPRHQPARRRALAVVAAGRAPRLREPRPRPVGSPRRPSRASVAERRAADRHHQRRDRAARLARRPPRGVRVDRRRRGRRGRSLAAPAERPRRRGRGRRRRGPTRRR